MALEIKKAKKPEPKPEPAPAQAAGGQSTDQFLDKLAKTSELIKAPHTEVTTAAGTLKTATAKIAVTHPDGGVEEKTEVVGATAIKGPTANVGMRVGKKINTGNYENTTLEISLFVPSSLVEEEIDETFYFIRDWLDKKMGELLDDGSDGKKG